jgi:cytoskeletal protein RodZ
MPNVKSVPGVRATKTKRGRRRHRSKVGNWWRVIRFALIVKGIRKRRESSSPSFRQIALVVVGGGLAIVIIRGASKRAIAAKRARSADVKTQDQAPETRDQAAGTQDQAPDTQDQAPDTQDQAPTPDVPSAQTAPGADDGLTERVRAEMFENKG